MTASSDRDVYTGALNRDALRRYLEANRCEPNVDSPTQLIAFLGIDHLKAFNAHNGLQLGDEVLKRFVSHVGKMLENDALLYRVGGDTFVIVFSDGKCKSNSELLEQICHFARTELSPPQATHCGDPNCKGPTALSVSIGVAMLKHGMSRELLLQQAEERMYEAKRSGRNQICE